MPSYDFIFHTGSSEIQWAQAVDQQIFDQDTKFIVLSGGAESRTLFRAISASVFVHYLDDEEPSGSLSDVVRLGLILSGPKA